MLAVIYLIWKIKKNKMKIIWLADLHLNFIGTRDLVSKMDLEDNKTQIKQFCECIIDQYNPDALMIGGDISNSKYLEQHLNLLNRYFKKKIYFVLGNHDFYHSSIKKVSEFLKGYLKKHRNLIWLDNVEPIYLTDKTALIGSSLWNDGRAGNFETSNVWLSDYQVIEELKSSPYYTRDLQKLLKYYAEIYTDHLIDNLELAIKNRDDIIMVTHVPAFREASFYDGKVQNDNWAPHFVCKIAGDKIREVMDKHPDKQLTIYSSHTHGAGEKRISDNIYVVNSESKYGRLQIQKMIEVE